MQNAQEPTSPHGTPPAYPEGFGGVIALPLKLFFKGGIFFFLFVIASATGLWFLITEARALLTPLLLDVARPLTGTLPEAREWLVILVDLLMGCVWVPLTIAFASVSVRLFFIRGTWPVGSFLLHVWGGCTTCYGALLRILQIWQVYLVPVLAVFLVDVISSRYSDEETSVFLTPLITASVVAWIVFRLLPYFFLPFVMTLGGYEVERAKSFAFHLVAHYRGFYVSLITFVGLLMMMPFLLSPTVVDLRSYEGVVGFTIWIYSSYVLACGTVFKLAKAESQYR